MVARKARRGNPHGLLTIKLLRDMRDNAMQFLAMMLLCALGSFVFGGLDATWRMQQQSIEPYLSAQHLADFWVKAADLQRADLLKLQHLEGVEAILPRTTLTLDIADTEPKVTAAVHAYHQNWSINTPYLVEGELLSARDRRGVLVEQQFAQAQGWSIGSTIKLKVQNEDRSLIVRGLVLSPEYLITSEDIAPTPDTYGFLLMTTDALPGLPLNECLIRLAADADVTKVEREIQQLLPEAIVIGQKNHSPTVTTRSYIRMFRELCFLFPVIAYFVAVLIVITTLSRMIDNERLEIGTMKALGYPPTPIRIHYVAYAYYPAAVGSLIGLFAGYYTLPRIIWRLVGTNVRVPEVLNAPISWVTWLMTVAEVLLAIFICVHQIYKSLKETTADLLRPKPPKSGARVLLEYWSGLWKRLSFNTKMVIRNLMRNKSRTLMSMIGVLFCNMLIICSFGLQESIPYFAGRYYSGTLQYDLRAELDPAEAGTMDSYRMRLQADRVDGVMEKTVNLRTDTASRTVRLTVLPTDQRSYLLDARQTSFSMPDRGLMIGTKLAEIMDLQPGDTAHLWLPGKDRAVDVPIVSIAHVNIGLDLFISQTAWESLREGAFHPTALLITGMSAAEQNKLENVDEVTSIKWPDDQFNQTMRIMDSAKMAFSLLSGVALGLAFVICYNMGLINFTERTREYATLKVLGYHQKEIRRLMMRENNWTSVIGTLLGILPGIALVGIILKMCEFESMVFSSHVTMKSVILSSVITLAFSMLIEILLTRKVRGINMVEALKSVE